MLIRFYHALYKPALNHTTFVNSRAACMKVITYFIFIVVGFLILAGIAFFGYQFYEKLHTPAASPFKAIPSNAALIVKINKPSTFWQESNKGNQLWSQLFVVPKVAELRKEVSKLDSILGSQRKVKAIIHNNPIYVVLSPTVAETYDLLYLMNLDEPDAEEQISEFIEEVWPRNVRFTKSGYGGSSLYLLQIDLLSKPIYFAIKNRLLIISAQSILVKQSIDRLSLNITADEDPIFQEINASSGKNVDANIFIHYPVIANFISSFTQNDPATDNLRVGNFATWSGLDVIQKRDQWLISGYTACREESEEYLTLFRGQQPQKMSVATILPEDVYSFTWLGLSDPQKYRDQLENSQSWSPLYFTTNPLLQNFEQQHDVQFQDYFLPWMGSELCTFRLDVGSNTPDIVNLGLLTTTNREVADSCLKALIKFGSKQKAPFTYKRTKIYNLSIPGLLASVYGNIFLKTNGAYFTILDENIIFGPSEGALKKVINAYLDETTLQKNQTYAAFSANLVEECNMNYYCNSIRSFDLLQHLFNEPIQKELQAAKDSLVKFSAFGLQITNKDESFLTSVGIYFGQMAEKKGPLLWQTTLDNPIQSTPVFVPKAFSGEPGIALLDTANILYLLDESGSIQWKLALPGKPLGDIQTVYNRLADSTFLVVNTESELCVIDLSGVFAHNSPFPLPFKATTGCISTDKISNVVPLVLLPLTDMKVHAFQVNGKEFTSWTPSQFSQTIKQPIEEIVLNSKAIFVVKQPNGTAEFISAFGKPISRQKTQTTIALQSRFYPNKTNAKGELLTTSPDGSLVYCKLDGRNSKIKFNNFTPQHRFFYMDINGDRLSEFIYFDVNKIYYYDKYKRLIYDFAFPAIIEQQFVVSTDDGRKYIGAVSEKTGDIFLFGKKGMIPLDPVIRGKTRFIIPTFRQETGPELIIGEGKMVKAFQLTKL